MMNDDADDDDGDMMVRNGSEIDIPNRSKATLTQHSSKAIGSSLPTSISAFSLLSSSSPTS